MTQEEKAKAYDLALEKARQLCAYPTTKPFIRDLQDLFPELKKSEDERIRKELIEFVKSRLAGFPDCKRFTDWLEKQGEQKPVIEMKTPEESLGIDSNIYNKIVDECIYGEQNPADKVEPKFKVGDFIVNDYCMGKVIELTNDAYLLDTGQGIPFSCEHNAHLWTIQDAKNGDVLAFDDETIVIFKDLYNSSTFHSYCHIEDSIFDISEDGMPDWWEGKGFHPATKEQRDTLMKTMTDAGYTFNFEKKELKKIEKKPWSEDDKKMIESCIFCFEKDMERAKSKFYESDILPDIIDGYKKKIDWLKSLKDRVLPQIKQEWKQENTDDLTDFENVMMHIGGSFFGENAGLDPNDTNAIKEQANLLLELVPKQKWSEEDEKIIDGLITICDEAQDNIPRLSVRFSHVEALKNWLKSLKERYTWKPSEGQLECLSYAIEKAEKDWSPLTNNRIYLTLKALKEQLEKLQ